METGTQPSLESFGQMPTPEPGATIKSLTIKDDDNVIGYYDQIKDRYAWYPFSDISFIGRMTQHPMSVNVVVRGRIAYIQPVPYKAIDNSLEAFEREENDELPLKTFLQTPFAQCAHLHLGYAERGMRILEHLKAIDPDLVVEIERVLLPTVPKNLLALADYLLTRSRDNLNKAGFDPRTYDLAARTLDSMIEGTSIAINYCRNLIAESESEILTRKNKGVGKASLDQNDRYAYVMLNKPIPAEETLEGKADKTTELLEQLVAAISGAKPVAPVAVQGEDQEKVELKRRLDEMELKLAALIVSKSDGAPTIEDKTPASTEEVEQDLKTRLKQTRKS